MQFLIALLTSLVCLVLWGQANAVAALYGSAIAFANTLLRIWHMRRAARIAGADIGRNLRLLYSCAAQRFVLTGVLFALGMGIVYLMPLPMLVGFVLAQLALFMEGFERRNSRQTYVK